MQMHRRLRTRTNVSPGSLGPDTRNVMRYSECAGLCFYTCFFSGYIIRGKNGGYLHAICYSKPQSEIINHPGLWIQVALLKVVTIEIHNARTTLWHSIANDLNLPLPMPIDMRRERRLARV